MLAGALEIQLSANVAKLANDMRQAREAVGGTMRHIESVVGTAKSALAGLAGALTVGAFTSMVRGTVDALDSLNDLSKSTSLAVETLGGLNLAARQSGGDLNSIGDSINKLSQNIGADAEKFRLLGVVASDPLEAFKQLADVFNAIQDPTTRAAVAAQALGKSWAGAAPLLAEGGARIQEMVDKGMRLSGITKDAAEAADKFNDQLAELSTTLNATKVRLVSEMLPGLNDVAAAMREAAKEGSILTTVWVGLGGIMANLIGATDAARTRDRLREINDQLEIAGKQLAAGSLSPPGANRSMFAWLVPDAKLGEQQLAKIRATIDALEKEKARLTGAATGPALSTAELEDAALGGAMRAAQAAAQAAKFLDDNKPKKPTGLTDTDSQYRSMLRGLQERLIGEKQLTEVQKLTLQLDAMSAAQRKAITPEREKELMQLARMIDSKNAETAATEAYVKAFEVEQEQRQAVARELAEEENRRGAVILAQGDQIEQYRRESELLGMTAEKRALASQLLALETAGIGRNTAAYQQLGEAWAKAIGERQAIEAVTQQHKQAASDVNEFWVQAARSMQSGMSDFFFSVMQGKLDDIGMRFKSAVDRMVADALAAEAQTRLFGSSVGKGQVGGLVGRGLDWLGINSGRAPVTDLSSKASAEDIARLGGGGSSGGGLFGAIQGIGSWLGFFDQGTPYVPRTGLAVLHQGERVVPAAENARMGGGRPITQNFHFAAPQERRSQLQVAAEAQRGLKRAERNL